MLKKQNKHKQTGLTVEVLKEPLKSVFEIDDLSLRSNEYPQAFPEPATALGIELRSKVDRVKAAQAADIFLFQSTQQCRRRSDSPALADRLVSALGVWALTRSRLGFFDEAQVAMGKVFEWVAQTEPGGTSSTYAFAYQRSARQLAEQSHTHSIVSRLLGLDVDREFRIALIEHLLTAGGKTALALTRERSTPTTFEIQRRLALLHLKGDRLEKAADLLATSAKIAVSLLDQRNLLAAQAALAEAQGNLPTAIRCQIAAVELASEVCGTVSHAEPETLHAELLSIQQQTLAADAPETAHDVF